MNTPRFSVVIPAFNEAGRIGATLAEVVEYLESRRLHYEILVVDDGSRDSTRRVTADFASRRGAPVRLLGHRTNAGKGWSVRLGMLEARGELALMSDADLSTPISELPKLERAVINQGCDIAFGSRDVAGSRVEVHQPWLRETGGKIFNRIMRLANGLEFRDTQCGFKLFRMATTRPLFARQRIHGYGFDVEILYQARRRGLRLREIPVRWRHREGSRVNLLTDSFSMLAELALIRWHGLRGDYD